MEKVKAISNVDLKETMFGMGEVEIKANVKADIPKEAFEAWKARGIELKLADEKQESVDELDGMDYNAIKELAKGMSLELPQSIKKVELIALIREKRGVKDGEQE